MPSALRVGFDAEPIERPYCLEDLPYQVYERVTSLHQLHRIVCERLHGPPGYFAPCPRPTDALLRTPLEECSTPKCPADVDRVCLVHLADKVFDDGFARVDDRMGGRHVERDATQLHPAYGLEILGPDLHGGWIDLAGDPLVHFAQPSQSQKQ